MQWLRLRPEEPEELDMVDWRGRWYDDVDDEYDEEEGEGDEDRPMEDFDPVGIMSYVYKIDGCSYNHIIHRRAVMKMWKNQRKKRKTIQERIKVRVDQPDMSFCHRNLQPLHLRHHER